jgi:hypothetical protein
MELIIIIILSLCVGIILGGGYIDFTKKYKLDLVSFSKREPIVYSQPFNLNVFEKSTSHFDTLEFRFIRILLEANNNELTVKELNEILHLGKLSNENQRQRRHLFLKDLNVKLKMLYNVNDCIERKSSLDDRRVKTYHISSNAPKEDLKKLFMS